ncbi:hypothetical protein C0991_009081 [Blastosporella zonata]|nr:hypothetical protein C0991_009081 [Blastosporella zonata]
MSLDQNLFTLHVTQNKDNPHIVDLVDPSGTIHYRKHRLPGTEYKVEVYGLPRKSDPTSQSLLITASAPMATSKAKTLELYNPTILVDLKYTGTLSFRWNFKWEDHEFEWKREECFMLRKPDPPVLVAIAKEPAGRLKTTSIQILDYNLNRFDIEDRKGLEIVILTALLTFSDVNEGYHTPQHTPRNVSRTNSAPLNASAASSPQPTQLAEEIPPPPPPKPAPKTGVDRIAEMQASLGEYNEITVEEEGQVQHYAEYCSRLLEDDAMLFVTICSAAAEQVPKVLQVVEQTKRIRYKAGLSDETELHQYVVYDTDNKKKGPRRINLNDNVQPTTTYTPPTSLTVHLSKIDMPELEPKPTHIERPRGTSSQNPGKDHSNKETRKKEEKKASRPPTPPVSSREPERSRGTPSPHRPGSSSGPAKLTKHGQSSVPAAYGYAQAHDHIHAPQLHHHQPSPSPSQLSNPSIYTTPPPDHIFRPHGSSENFASPSISFPTPTMPTTGTLNKGWDRPPNNSYHSSSFPGQPFTVSPVQFWLHPYLYGATADIPTAAASVPPAGRKPTTISPVFT